MYAGTRRAVRARPVRPLYENENENHFQFFSCICGSRSVAPTQICRQKCNIIYLILHSYICRVCRFCRFSPFLYRFRRLFATRRKILTNATNHHESPRIATNLTHIYSHRTHTSGYTQYTASTYIHIPFLIFGYFHLFFANIPNWTQDSSNCTQSPRIATNHHELHIFLHIRFSHRYPVCCFRAFVRVG